MGCRRHAVTIFLCVTRDRQGGSNHDFFTVEYPTPTSRSSIPTPLDGKWKQPQRQRTRTKDAFVKLLDRPGSKSKDAPLPHLVRQRLARHGNVAGHLGIDLCCGKVGVCCKEPATDSQAPPVLVNTQIDDNANRTQ